MSDIVTVALIGALSTAVPSLVAAVFAFRASQHAKDAANSSARTEVSTNGKMEQLLKLTAASSKAEGILEGQKHGD